MTCCSVTTLTFLCELLDFGLGLGRVFILILVAGHRGVTGVALRRAMVYPRQAVHEGAVQTRCELLLDAAQEQGCRGRQAHAHDDRQRRRESKPQSSCLAPGSRLAAAAAARPRSWQ